MLEVYQKDVYRILIFSWNTFCFLDEILIVSKGDEKKPKEMVVELLKRLDGKNLALKPSKFESFETEVTSLSLTLSPCGINPKMKKMGAILNLHQHRSQKHLRSFMGSINHLFKFIQNAASVMDKLWHHFYGGILKNEVNRIWVKKMETGEEKSWIFEDTKQAVACITKINCYNPSNDTRVNCNASHSSLWATLEQNPLEGDWIPIAIASHNLNTQEKKHSTNELELLAEVWSVERFKYNLLGKAFMIALKH